MHSDWHRAKHDLAFARQKAREVHDARMAALDLSPEQRRQIRKMSEYLSKNFFSYPGRERILAFYEEIASDLDPTPDVENTIWFLKDVVAFLPKQGQPSKEALQGAIFWLLLNFHRENPDDMGVGVGWSVNHAGTQNEDSKLVSSIRSELIAAGIEQYGSAYQSSAVANAAKAVLGSSMWSEAISQDTKV